MLSKKIKSRLLGALLAAAVLCFLAPAGAFAAPSLNWTSPADGSVFNIGTMVAPTGTAAGFATGDGLDLALVLDASGSMGINATAGGVTKTRTQWQADAAIALVNSLPNVNTSVAVIQFGSGATVRLALTPTTSAQDIINAINAVPGNQGSTAIGDGINVAQAHLNANGTLNRSRQMVVISDGSNNDGANPVTAATNAKAAGTIVHTVVIPGGNTSQMQSIAVAGGGSFVNFSNPNDLVNIENFFGAGGGFVGLERLDITLPDGTVINNYATDAFGNFVINPAWAMLAGNNTFTATAYFQDQTSLTRELNLIGRTQPVPAPSAVGLFGLGLGLIGLINVRRRKS